MTSAIWAQHPSVTLRADPELPLRSVDGRATPGFDGGKNAGRKAAALIGERLSLLQEKLFAASRVGDPRSVLLVLQGMDTAGKGGIVRHVIGMVDPQGVHARGFGVPTEEERAHHYLWRFDQALPPAGRIGVFDRSHYEDVLVVRVHNMVPPAVWEGRYDEINAWEQRRIEQGTTIIKCVLAVSRDEQLERLGKRLTRPDKYWKYNPGDLDERAHWPDYMDAYQDVLDRCNPDEAPWYVIPADRKWFARLAVAELLLHALESLDLNWPEPTFDVAHEKARLKQARRSGT